MSNFSRSVQVVDTTGINGNYVSLLQANAYAALDSWGRYLTGGGSIDVRVEIDSSLPNGILAYGGPVWAVQAGGNVWQAGTIYELQNGVDPNGSGFGESTADIIVYVSGALLRSGLIWLDPTAGAGGYNGGAGQYDMLTILRHEIGHGLGFVAGIDTLQQQQSGAQRLTFDTSVSFSGTTPYFFGSTAVALNNGNQVRLTDGDASHISTSLPDLMNPNLAPGVRLDVSALDAGMLHDAGIAFARYALAPIMTAANNSYSVGTVVSAASLFSLRDLDGDSPVTYQFYDGTSGAGSWVLNGVTQAAGQWIDVSASQLYTMQYRVGSGADQLSVRASDGRNWSNWAHFNVNGVNQAPTLAVSNPFVHGVQTLAVANLISAYDADGDAIAAYQFGDSDRSSSSGNFLLNGSPQPAGVEFTISASQLSQLSFRTGANGTERLWARASDGNSWGAWREIWVTSTNIAPLLATTNPTVHGVQTLAASGFVSASDADGDPIVAYQFGDSERAAESGSFLVNGVVQAAGVEFTVSAADLANTVFRTGANGAERLWVRASDGSSWSDWRLVTVTSANTAPLVTATNRTVHGVQTLAASSLFSASDADGDPIVAYQFGDSERAAESGSFLLGGVAQPAGTEFEVSAANLANLSFRTGASGVERLWVRASDGSSWGAWQLVTVTSANTAPQVTAINATVHGVQTLAASSLFSASDADGDPIVAYQFGDSERAASSGSFLLGGVAQLAGTEFEVSAANLSNLTFRTGASGAERLWVRASDGNSWGAWQLVTVTSANIAPQVTALNPTVHGVQTLAASSLFSASDPDGDPIVAYQFGDSERAAESGSFLLGGVAQPAGTEFEVSAANLANLTFRTGASGVERLWVRASDGSSWGGWQQVTVTSANVAPQVTGIDRTLFAGTSVAASTLFSVTDADGDPIVAYQFGDSERAATSGSFMLNGVAQPAGVEWELSAAQLGNLTFRAGAAGTTERLWVRASDGSSWSGWQQVNVTAIEDTNLTFSVSSGNDSLAIEFTNYAADLLANLSGLSGSGDLANFAGTTSSRTSLQDPYGMLTFADPLRTA